MNIKVNGVNISVENGNINIDTKQSTSIEKYVSMSQESVYSDFEGTTPVAIRSEEAFPRVNSLITFTGTKMYNSIDDIAKDQKVKDTMHKITEYCQKKGWQIVKEADSDQLKTLWTTFISKDTSDYNRPRAKTETWKVIENVPVMFLEYDENRTMYDPNGYPYTYHVHYINAHVFLKKPGANRIFSKQVITKVKLKSEGKRTRK